MKKHIAKARLDMLSLCMKLEKEGIHVFFDYSPHTRQIRLFVYDGEWRKDSESLATITIYEREGVEPLKLINNALKRIAGGSDIKKTLNTLYEELGEINIIP